MRSKILLDALAAGVTEGVQQREADDAAARAADVFESLGTDSAIRMAGILRGDPRAGRLLGSQMGGLGRMYSSMEESAIRTQSARAEMAKLYRERAAGEALGRIMIPGLPEPERHAHARAALQFGASIGDVQKALSPENPAQDRVLKAIRAIDPQKFTPSSYQQFMDGVQAGTVDPDVLVPMVTAEDDRKGLSGATGLRKAFNAENKLYLDVRDFHETIINAPRTGSGDYAAIVAYVKVLDPGSVARGGEVALAQKAQSLIDQAKLRGEKVLAGRLISDQLRDEIEQTSRGIISARTAEHFRTISSQRRMARAYRVPESEVILDPTVKYRAEGIEYATRSIIAELKAAGVDPTPERIKQELSERYGID